MRLSRISRVLRVPRTRKVRVSAVAATAVAGAALTAVLITGSGGDSAGSGSRADSADEDRRTAMALTRFRTSTADGHIMRGLLAWDLEGVAVAGSPASASDNTLATKARPAAPGPVTTAVQAARRASTLKSGHWARHPY